MKRRRRDEQLEDQGGPRIDTAVVLLVLLAIAVLLFLTFDLWTPHDGPHR